MKTVDNPSMKTLSSIDRAVGAGMRALCIVCLTLLLILLSGNVLFRFVPIMSMGWYDEIVEMIFAWLVFIGAAALWRESTHFRVEWIYSKLKDRTAGNVIGIAIELLSLFFLIVMTYQGLRLTMLATDWTPILKLPKRIQYVDIPIAGGLMVIYSIRNIGRHISSLLPPQKKEFPHELLNRNGIIQSPDQTKSDVLKALLEERNSGR